RTARGGHLPWSAAADRGRCGPGSAPHVLAVGAQGPRECRRDLERPGGRRGRLPDHVEKAGRSRGILERGPACPEAVKGPLRVETGVHVVPPGLKKLPGSAARRLTRPPPALRCRRGPRPAARIPAPAPPP